MDTYGFLLVPLLLFVFCYSGVCLLAQNLDKEDYRVNLWRILQPCLLLILFGYLARENMGQRSACVLVIYLTGAVTAFTFPGLYHMTHRGEPGGYSYPVDFSCGSFVTVLLVVLADILFSVFRIKAASALLTAAEILFLLPCLFQLLYYLYYGKCIDELAIQSLYDTNKMEAKEYVRLIPKSIILSVLAVFVLLAFCIYRINASSFTDANAFLFHKYSPVFFAGVLFLLFFNGRHAVFKKTGLAELCCQVKNHSRNLAESRLSEKNYPPGKEYESVLKNERFGTVLVVIGESANRLHMKAFSNYERETTPWLSEKSKGKEFFLFPNSYASWIQTPEAVRLALTNMNQYSAADAGEEISIINIANKLGFHTWWYSAQGYSGEKSTDVSVVANAAKTKRWLMQDYPARQYDEKLLNYVKDINTRQNNFAVVHLEGSHADFHLRYPAQFEKWPYEKSDPHGSNPYDNSILYTDYILSELFSYAKENLNLQVMVYFSDHGSLIGQKRKSYFTGFEDTRIPLFVYLSDAYQKAFPESAAALRSHTLSYFTNDLIFDLLCGLLKVKGLPYNEKNDLSSDSYQFTKDTLTTNLGKTYLSEDVKEALK